MITFSQLGSYGRFGNALWQYASIRGISQKTGYKLYIPNPLTTGYHQQPCLLRYFQIPEELYTYKPGFLYKYIGNMQNAQEFNKNVLDVRDTTDFIGYFQNTKYFFDSEDLIRQDLTFTHEIETISQQILKGIRNNIQSPIISIHIKRGELPHEIEQNNINFYGKGSIFTNGSILGQYLQKAIQYCLDIIPNAVFLLFTNDNADFNKFGVVDDALDWCKANIQHPKIYYHENYNTIVDFAIMSICDHNILCHSTTFGWWAAWLNKNSQKVVVAPNNYFVLEPDKFVDGFYPKKWILL